MDLELARTFLAVANKGSLVAAAEQLHVTQTTVTARIKNLEEQLNAQLFKRTSQGTLLTEQGRFFVSYAQSLLNTWDAAQRSLATANEALVTLRIGAETSLWSSLFYQWVIDLKRHLHDVRLATYVSDRASLLARLDRDEVDILLLNAPHYAHNIRSEAVLEEKLIMIEALNKAQPYIYIDWGEAFARQHKLAFPEIDIDQFTSNMGPLALETLATLGGRGYFRSRTAQPYIARGVARQVASAPEFLLPVYAVYANENGRDGLSPALMVLRQHSLPRFHE